MPCRANTDDVKEQTLYYFANGTHGSPPNETFVATQLHTLVNVSGRSMAEPIKNFKLLGIGLRDTAPTMLEPHAVPSGGDCEWWPVFATVSLDEQ